MGAYRLIHTFVLDDASQTTERFFYFKKSAKERAAILVNKPRLKWEVNKTGSDKEFCKLSVDETFLLEPIYFER
jgi:hypothetical protein